MTAQAESGGFASAAQVSSTGTGPTAAVVIGKRNFFLPSCPLVGLPDAFSPLRWRVPVWFGRRLTLMPLHDDGVEIRHHLFLDVGDAALVRTHCHAPAGRLPGVHLATSPPAVRRELADAIGIQVARLEREGIEFQVWDAEQLSLWLKERPSLVYDFFGRAWTEAFCGKEAAGAVPRRGR